MSKTRSRRRGSSLRWSWCVGGTAAERHEHSTANSAPAAASESLQSVRGDAAMQSKYEEVTPRYFNPTWAPTLSDEARKAVNDAFDAMSAWRIETASNNEKNSEQVIDKLASAARARGWLGQLVEDMRPQRQA